MPKESVYPSNPQPTGIHVTNGEEVEPPKPFLIQVGWHRDFQANIGVDLPEGETFLSHFYGSHEQTIEIGTRLQAYLRQAGVAMADTETSDQEEDWRLTYGELVLGWVEMSRPPSISSEGLWVDITRDMANRLITLLRKARDAAYGKDA